MADATAESSVAICTLWPVFSGAFGKGKAGTKRERERNGQEKESKRRSRAAIFGSDGLSTPSESQLSPLLFVSVIDVWLGAITTLAPAKTGYRRGTECVGVVWGEDVGYRSLAVTSVPTLTSASVAHRFARAGGATPETGAHALAPRARRCGP